MYYLFLVLKFQNVRVWMDQFDIPITLASNFFSQSVSHDPLKPVCPVTITVLSLKTLLNSLFKLDFFELDFLFLNRSQYWIVYKIILKNLLFFYFFFLSPIDDIFVSR